MASRSSVNQRAKRFEKKVTADLVEAGIPAEWVERRNYGTKDTDVRILPAPELKVDCKSRVAFAHHTLLQSEIVERYCGPTDEPVMPTHARNEREWLVTIRGRFFMRLLKFWLAAGKP